MPGMYALLVHKQPVCYKTFPCAVTKKNIRRGVGGGGGQEQLIKE